MNREPYRIGLKDIERERVEILTKAMRKLKRHRERKEPVNMSYWDRMERMKAANSRHVYKLAEKRRKKKTGNEARKRAAAFFEKMIPGTSSRETSPDGAGFHVSVL